MASDVEQGAESQEEQSQATVTEETLAVSSDEALDNLIHADGEEEEGEVSEEEVEEETEDAADEEEGESEEEAEEQEEEGETGKEESEEEETVPPEPTLEELKAEREKLRKQVEDKEAFIQRQANELGTQRKLIRDRLGIEEGTERKQPRRSATDAEFEEEDDGEELILTQAELDRRVAEKVRIELARAEYDDLEKGNVSQKAESLVKERAPELFSEETKSVFLSEMEALARNDGEAEEDIARFKSDPLGANPKYVLELASRARDRLELKVLKESLVAKKKKVKISEKIRKATKQTPVISASSGGASGGTKVVSERQLVESSGDELDAVIAEGNEA